MMQGDTDVMEMVEEKEGACGAAAADAAGGGGHDARCEQRTLGAAAAADGHKRQRGVGACAIAHAISEGLAFTALRNDEEQQALAARNEAASDAVTCLVDMSTDPFSDEPCVRVMCFPPGSAAAQGAMAVAKARQSAKDGLWLSSADDEEYAYSSLS